MKNIWDLFYQLPFELQNIIRYKSGLQTKEAKIIKDFNENLCIKKEAWVEGGSYIEHITNIGYLNETAIILVFPAYLFIDSD